VKDIQHPHLLKATYFGLENDAPFLVMPYCPGGSVYDDLKKFGAHTEMKIAKLLAQVAGGLDYLHGKGIFHQDVKPDNVLIDKNGSYLLTDFGISAQRVYKTGETTSITIPYASPERFKDFYKPSSAADVFSLGVMIYELCTGQLPWPGQGTKSITPQTPLPGLPGRFSQELNELMKACLHYKPEARPDASEIKRIAEKYIATGSWDFVTIRDTIEIPVPGPKPKDGTPPRSFLFGALIIITVISLGALTFILLKQKDEPFKSSMSKKVASTVTEPPKDEETEPVTTESVETRPDTTGEKSPNQGTVNDYEPKKEKGKDMPEIGPEITQKYIPPPYKNLDTYIGIVTSEKISAENRKTYIKKHKPRALKEFTSDANVVYLTGTTPTDYFTPEQYLNRLEIIKKRPMTKEMIKDDAGKIKEWKFNE
jgi:serine/threonine-protein kinase